MEEVVGSIPTRSTKSQPNKIQPLLSILPSPIPCSMLPRQDEPSAVDPLL